MQFSTDLPCGVRVVEYIEHRGDTRLPMNANVDADAAYIAEKGLRIGPVTLTSWPVGRCSRCNGVIHNAPYLSNAEQGQFFCSRECRDNTKAKEQSKARRRTRHFKLCKQCDVRFLAKRADQEFHAPTCRVRWNRNHPSVTDSCNDPSGTRINTGHNDPVFTVPPVSAPTPLDFAQGGTEARA